MSHTPTSKQEVKQQPTFRHWWLWVSCLVTALIIALWLLPEPYYTTGFRTLSEMQEHAATIDEWIKMENDNELLPSYEQYYKKAFTPTLLGALKNKLQWILSRCYLCRQPAFSSTYFKSTLVELTQHRIAKGKLGYSVEKIEIKPSSKVIIFGVLQGAYHSFVRNLTQLKKLGILNEDLTLTSNDYSIVFLGNVVNRSPYTLDTFTAALRLMEQNPQQVVYLRGTNEFYDYWKDHTLKRELELRCANLSDQEIPLNDQVNQFFDTLPLTLYGTMNHWSDEHHLHYIKFMPFVHPQLAVMLNEDRYAHFLLNEQKEPLVSFTLQDQSPNTQEGAQKLLLRGVVKDILKRDFLKKWRAYGW